MPIQTAGMAAPRKSIASILNSTYRSDQGCVVRYDMTRAGSGGDGGWKDGVVSETLRQGMRVRGLNKACRNLVHAPLLRNGRR